MIVLTKDQGVKGKNLPKTLRGGGGDTHRLIVIMIVVVTVIPQILSQIRLQILNQIHRILIQVPLAMGNTGRGKEISASMGRRGERDESREEEASTLEVEDQDTSPDGMVITSL